MQALLPVDAAPDRSHPFSPMGKSFVDVSSMLHSLVGCAPPSFIASGQLTMLAHIRVGPLPPLPGWLAPFEVHLVQETSAVSRPEAKGTTESLQALIESKAKHGRATRDALTEALPKVHQLRHMDWSPILRA